MTSGVTRSPVLAGFDRFPPVSVATRRVAPAAGLATIIATAILLAVPAGVLAVVLVAAVLHVSWNTLVKRSSDGSLATVLIAGGGAVMCALALPFLPPIHGRAWVFVLASAVAQSIYYPLVAAAYRAGDMSQTYPLMRGTAPLLVAVASGPLIGETLTGGQWFGIGLISVGIFSIGLLGTSRPPPPTSGPQSEQADPGEPPGPHSERPGRRRRRPATATWLALLTACIIATYTLIDGTGSRASGAPFTYTAWIFLCTALPMVGIALIRRPVALGVGLRRHWQVGLWGGLANVGAYGLVLWAMTKAPIASVAALRETSILVATVIAVVVLKERLTVSRATGTVFILGGAIVLRLA